MKSNHESAIGFKSALDDDFNTSLAFAEMFKYANLLKKRRTEVNSETIHEDILRGMGEILGLLNNEYLGIDKTRSEDMIDNLSAEEIEELISVRQKAKEQKNFKVADEIRERLMENGVLLEDGFGGTTWKFRRIKN